MHTSFAQGEKCDSDIDSFAQGGYCTASGFSFAQGSLCSAFDYSFARGRGLSAKNSAYVVGGYNKRGDGSVDNAAFVIGDGFGTAINKRHDLMLVTYDGEVTMYSGTADTVGIPLVATLRALSAWATAQGWTGM